MFSKRLRTVFLWRLYYWQTVVITPFRWKRKTGKVLLSSKIMFRFWSILLVYMSFFTGSTFLSSLSLLLGYSQGNVTIIVVTFTFFIIGSTALAGLIIVHQSRDEFREFINQAFELDEYLQGNMPKFNAMLNSFIHFLSFSLHLETYSKIQKKTTQQRIKSSHTFRQKLLIKIQTLVNKYFPQSDPFCVLMELLIMFTSFATAIGPPLFSLMVIYEERDPLHKLLVDHFNIKPKLELKFLPLLLVMAFITSQIGNTFSFLLNSGLMFMHFAHSWVVLLTSRITLKWSLNDARKKPNQKAWKTPFNLGTRADLPLVYAYRKLQVLHRIINKALGTPAAASHIFALMMLGVLSFLTIIRWHHQFQLITLGIIVFAAFLSLFVPYCEFLAFSIIKQNSQQFIKRMRMRNKRNSMVTKMVKSLWPVQMETGNPFFSISHNSILFYMESLFNFLTDLLLSV